MPRRMCGKEDGFTLIEVLVAMIVLAVGLLGLASMQIAGVKSSHSAHLRTQATFAAYDLSDRMRAKPSDYVGRTLTVDSDQTDFSDAPEDFAAWAGALAATFPAPASGDRASVNCIDGGACAAGDCEIVVRWNDSRPEGGAERAAELGRDTASLEFHVCTRLPQ